MEKVLGDTRKGRKGLVLLQWSLTPNRVAQSRQGVGISLWGGPASYPTLLSLGFFIRKTGIIEMMPAS